MAEPKKRAPRGLYKRQPYSPEMHCGAPKDRSRETLERRAARNLEKLAELQTLLPTLAAAQKAKSERKIARYESIGGYHAIELQRLDVYGPDDRPCMLRKGYRTTHLGEGLCRKHCDCQGRQGYHATDKFEYSRSAKDKQLKAIMDEIQLANTDLLNMEPEVLLLKGRTQLFIDRKQDDDPETVRSLMLLVEQIRKVVDSMNDRKFKTMITKEAFEYINFRMGEVVADELAGQPELLDRIVAKWDKITVESGEKRNRQVVAAQLSAPREG